MDARDIWLPGQEGLDPEKLDRLHWFIAELKRNGIYTNLNLHVSRTYPGLQEMTSERAFRYGKIVDNFHDPYIDLQEQYAGLIDAGESVYRAEAERRSGRGVRRVEQ